MKKYIERCEIAECGAPAVGTMNGVTVCERCRIGYTSVGAGVVFFAGSFHGVRGATYDDAAIAAHGGLIVTSDEA